MKDINSAPHSYIIKLELEEILLTEDNAYLLNDFTCGDSDFDENIKERLLEDSQITSYLVVNSDQGHKETIAVYSICCSGFIIQSSEKNYIYPAVEIKYFAVSEEYQDLPFSNKAEDGCVSSVIFDQVIYRINEFTDNVCGADKIILYAVPRAVEFYQKSGFESFEEFMLQSDHRYLEGCVPMFMDLCID